MIKTHCRHCLKPAMLDRHAFCKACVALFDARDRDAQKACDDYKLGRYFGLPEDNARIDREFDKRCRHGFDY